MDGLKGEDSIAQLCRREGIAQSLSAILTAIAGGHKQTDIGELLPWNYVRPV